MSSVNERFIPFRPRRRQEQKEVKKRVKPWPPPPVEHEDTERDIEWREEGVYEQIAKTYESIIEDTLRDEELAYYIVEFFSSVVHSNSKKVIDKLEGKILLHIEPLRSRVLIESPLEKLMEISKEKQYKYMENNIHIIRPLHNEEILAINITDDKWLNNNDEILIEVIPNTSNEKKSEYVKKTMDYVDDLHIQILNTPSDEFLKSKGIIVAKASVEQCYKIIENSNIIYKIYSSPRVNKNNVTSNSKGVKTVTNILNPKYIVCVIDTGINNINQLRNCIDRISFENIFNNGDDLDNHGTPISCLIVHGEGYNTNNPKYNIISHKTYSNTLERGNLFTGVINAIQLYKSRTKVFLCSGVYSYDNQHTREITTRLGTFIQENEICVIFSSGNIDPNYPNLEYPQYIRNFKIKHPSDALSISAVGGIVKKINNSSIGRINGPSPFTRCGSYTNLDASIKPETVQHAGNCDQIGNRIGLGVETYSNVGNRYEDIGTSLASPLFARIIANIYDIYGNEFSYPETARALAYSSCNKYDREFEDFFGFGESNFNNSIKASWICSKIFFEEKLPLEAYDGDQELIIYDQINFNAPAGVSDIILHLVHTDDYQRYLRAPRLNSHISVIAWKPGRESPATPRESFPYKNGVRNPGMKCHAKKLVWSYKRGTIGPWKIRFYPKSSVIPKPERNEVNLRYGGVITLLARKPEIESLTQRFKAANGVP